MENMLDMLHKQAQLLGAGNAHMGISGYKGDEQTTAVVSIYIGSRPANDVLDELYEWAEDTKQHELIKKIEELSALAQGE